MELAVSLRACWRMSSCCLRVGSLSLPSSFFTSRLLCTRLLITCAASRALWHPFLEQTVWPTPAVSWHQGIVTGLLEQFYLTEVPLPRQTCHGAVP